LEKENNVQWKFLLVIFLFARLFFLNVSKMLKTHIFLKKKPLKISGNNALLKLDCTKEHKVCIESKRLTQNKDYGLSLIMPLSFQNT
jgi:hypothetical protein